VRNIRRQLTLFVQQADAEGIEHVRSRFNPRQFELIKSHVTLCREDEIENINQVLNNLLTLNQKPISITFAKVMRLDNDRGVLMPSSNDNDEFYALRQNVLKGLVETVKKHEPHITLMHPRNSVCTDEIFKEIEKVNLPTLLYFKTIYLIEQFNGGEWRTLRSFELME
jgi:2'-5' RNA ligase